MGNHKYNIGDKVVFTNEFGVCFGVRTIVGLADGLTETDEPRYYVDPTDCPWFPTAESCLTLADEDDLSAAALDQIEYLQLKHGRPTTLDERASLLDLEYDI